MVAAAAVFVVQICQHDSCHLRLLLVSVVDVVQKRNSIVGFQNGFDLVLVDQIAAAAYDVDQVVGNVRLQLDRQKIAASVVVLAGPVQRKFDQNVVAENAVGQGQKRLGCLHQQQVVTRAD
jgi:hypothetical protein